jgi:PAS domain S-box-containing protein
MSEKPTYEELEQRNRELEKRLRIVSLAEKHYLKMLDCSPSVIYTKDHEGRYRSINKEFEKLSGLKSEDVIGKTDFELFSPSVAENSTRNDKQVIQTGMPKEIEEYTPVAGKMRIFLSTKYPLLDETGKIYGICGVSTDITERKKAEDALRENEEKYRLVFEEADVLISIYDRNGICQLMMPVVFVKLSTQVSLKSMKMKLSSLKKTGQCYKL